MPCRDFLDVRILVDNVPLHEYADHDQHPDALDSQTRYVEVKAGQKFEIVTTWRAGFNLRFAPCLYCEVYIDDSKYRIIPKPCETRGIPCHRGIIGNDICVALDGVSLRDEMTQQWHKHRFTFGAVGITETPTTHLTPEALAGLGSIRVKCYRAKPRLRTNPSISNGTVPKTIDEVSECMLKSRAIKNNVQYAPERPVHAPGLEYYDYIPIKGKHGKLHTTTFLYRSRKILQSLGYIPRSPSPPPDTSMMLERTEEMLRVAKQEKRNMNLQLLRLQERLAQAEFNGRRNTSNIVDLDDDASTIVASRSGSASASVKREGSVFVAKSSIVKTEPTTKDYLSHGTKRTRASDDDDLAEIAPPTKKPFVVIDLTDYD